jgi:DNA-binding Lrp family transcriptional regulator
MDDKDAEILNAIAKLKTGKSEAIEAETGIPKSTVHYRMSRLQEQGILSNDLYDVDLESLGLDLTVVSEITAEYAAGAHEEVGSQLGDVEGVNQVYCTMGDVDFIVVAHLPGREAVEELVEQFERIDAVEHTSSRFVISTVKDEPRPLNDVSMETLRDLVPDAAE